MKIEITPEDVIKYAELLEEVGWDSINVRNRLRGLTPEQRLEGLNPKQRLEGLDPKQRLEGLDLEQRLEGFDPEIIEAYLQKIKQNKNH